MIFFYPRGKILLAWSNIALHIFIIIDYAFRPEYRRLGPRHAAQANVCRTVILSQ